MGAHTPTGRQRGASLSAFSAVVMVALFLVTGLVVDGGQKAAAQRESEAAAAQAARIGVDAGAVAAVQGRPSGAVAVAAARASLRSQGVAGRVSLLPGGVLHVRVERSVPTVFLSLIGVGSLSADAEAAAQLHEG